MRKVRSAFIGGFVFMCLFAAAASPALAGSISGTVTAEGGGPLEGVDVCAWPEPESFDSVCDDTDAMGHYLLAELPGYDYLLRFSASRNNLRYVDEFYDDADLGDADTIHLEALQSLTVDASLAEGGSISGSVTDELSEQPIAGLVACAIDSEADPVRCRRSEADGSFLLNGLPSDQYSVEFETWSNEVNYQHEFWEDASNWAAATDLLVTAPETVSGIDAVIAPGAEVLGHVSNIETGGDLYGVRVCASPNEFQEWCDRTDLEGNYAIRGMPAGTYLIEFGVENGFFGRSVGEWWEHAASEEEADPLELLPPESRTGIDSALPWYYGESPPRTEPPKEEDAVALPLPIDPRRPPAPRPRKCKKGFHRKLVKGKKRCVRRHPRHLRHHKHR